MSGINCARAPIIFLVVLAVTSGPLFGQSPLSVFGAATPGVVDSGDAQPVVVGVKVFSDVPGQVLGRTFYKALTNTG
ncbi:MAG TPA: hypothetical protein VK579_11690, partial [Terriglobales bacterium]|nr:hypothetical protein [Terriglobales bacterium]